MRIAIAIALGLATLPLWWHAPAAEPEAKSSVFTGKVMLLKEYLEKQGGKIDRDAVPFAVVLVSEGKAYPIIKDDLGGRFFKDEQLLNKEYRVTARLVGGTMLQVLSVQSIKAGKPHDIYYWCDICAIRRHEKNDCECCGGPMELREEMIWK